MNAHATLKYIAKSESRKNNNESYYGFFKFLSVHNQSITDNDCRLSEKRKKPWQRVTAG